MVVIDGPLTGDQRQAHINLTEQRILAAVAEGPGTTNEITDRIGDRSRPTVSLALNRLLRAGLVDRTGRDWRLPEGEAQGLRGI